VKEANEIKRHGVKEKWSEKRDQYDAKKMLKIAEKQQTQAEKEANEIKRHGVKE
jgi:hypothetical protein